MRGKGEVKREGGRRNRPYSLKQIDVNLDSYLGYTQLDDLDVPFVRMLHCRGTTNIGDVAIYRPNSQGKVLVARIAPLSTTTGVSAGLNDPI